MSVEPPGEDEVHLWWAWAGAAQDHEARLLRLLDDDERRRAERFRVADAHARFIAARALTRLLVGQYTGAPPEEVAFAYGDRGKPRLARPQPTPALHLNLAHSGDTAVAAFAPAPLGVDVEALRPVPGVDRLARRYFADRERRWLATLPAAEREAGFLTVWTCKEAWLKATGVGVAVALREVEVDPVRPCLARLPGDDADRWTLLASRLPEPAVCTVAVRGTGWRLHVQELLWGAALERTDSPQ